jgi:hypothetical protein
MGAIPLAPSYSVPVVEHCAWSARFKDFSASGENNCSFLYRFEKSAGVKFGVPAYEGAYEIVGEVRVANGLPACRHRNESHSNLIENRQSFVRLRTPPPVSYW